VVPAFKSARGDLVAAAVIAGGQLLGRGLRGWAGGRAQTEPASRVERSVEVIDDADGTGWWARGMRYRRQMRVVVGVGACE
jgi:hypothetical protein